MWWWVNQGLLPGRGRWEIAESREQGAGTGAGSSEQGAGSTHLDGQSGLADTTVAQDHQLVQGHFPRHGGQWRGEWCSKGEEGGEGKFNEGPRSGGEGGRKKAGELRTNKMEQVQQNRYRVQCSRTEQSRVSASASQKRLD